MPTSLPTFLYHPRADDAARFDRLYDAVDRCDVGMELAKRVYYLGRPAFTSAAACPTSCVMVRHNGEVIFQFNRDFFDSLGGDEIVFVTLHEAMHIAFRHAERRQDRDPMVWNVACDIVINYLLLQQPPFATLDTPGFRKLIEGAATFERFKDYLLHVGPPAQLSADAIYERLTRHPQLRRWVTRIVRKLRPFHVDQFLDGPGAIAGRAAWERQLAGQRLDRVLNRQFMRGWSLAECGELRQVERAVAPRLPWDRLLVSTVHSLLDEGRVETWQPSRRLTMFYPDVLLPAERDDPRPGGINLLAALDASGSIDRGELDRLVAVTRTIPPQRVTITAISFDVRAYPFDLSDPRSNPRGGGGTRFACIEEFALEMPMYPDLIVVLTDGAGPEPNPKWPARWVWVLTPHGTDMHVVNIGRVVWM